MNWKIKIIIASTLLVASTTPVHAVTRVAYEGQFWATGAFPPSEPGDRLSMVARVAALDSRFGVDFAGEEVTLVVRDLVSLGQVDIGGGVLRIIFQTDAIAEFYRDPSRDSVFYPQPPNAYVPSTFSNGTLFLRVHVGEVFMFVDTNTGQGSYEFQFLNFVAGSGLPLIGPSDPEFGTLFWDGEVAVSSQGGYAGTCNGALGFMLVGVEPTDWGRVKFLYR